MDEAGDKGFWSFIRRTRLVRSFSEGELEHIDKRQRRVCTKGFGVSYEWITEATAWRSGNGGQFHWASVDGIFRGVSKEDFDEVKGKFTNANLERLEGEAAADSNRPYREK